VNPPRDLADALTRIDQLEQQLADVRACAERIRIDDLDTVELPDDLYHRLLCVAVYGAATGIGDRILMILDGKADR